MTLPYLLTGTPPISDPPNPQVTKDIRATGTKKPLDKSSLPKQSAKKSAKRSAKRRKQETSEAPKNHSADLTEENFLQKYISDYLDPWNCYCEKTKALRETLVEQFNAIDSENFLILINSLEEAQKGINQLSVQLQKLV